MVFADSENFQVDTKFSLEKQKKHKALVIKHAKYIIETRISLVSLDI